MIGKLQFVAVILLTAMLVLAEHSKEAKQWSTAAERTQLFFDGAAQHNAVCHRIVENLVKT
jgi:hypothetical protein